MQEKQTDIKKKQEGSEVPGDNTDKHEIRKQQNKDGNTDNRTIGYNTTTRNGLDEKISN